jgi:uncharacterized membrane protein
MVDYVNFSTIYSPPVDFGRANLNYRYQMNALNARNNALAECGCSCFGSGYFGGFGFCSPVGMYGFNMPMYGCGFGGIFGAYMLGNVIGQTIRNGVSLVKSWIG